PRPADNQRLAAGRMRVAHALCGSKTKQQMADTQYPCQAQRDHYDTQQDRPEYEGGCRIGLNTAENTGELKPHQEEYKHVDEVDEDSEKRLAGEAVGGRAVERHPAAKINSGRDRG